MAHRTGRDFTPAGAAALDSRAGDREGMVTAQAHEEHRPAGLEARFHERHER